MKILLKTAIILCITITPLTPAQAGKVTHIVRIYAYTDDAGRSGPFFCGHYVDRVNTFLKNNENLDATVIRHIFWDTCRGPNVNIPNIELLKKLYLKSLPNYKPTLTLSWIRTKEKRNDINLKVMPSKAKIFW